jgi:hypothetical protein
MSTKSMIVIATATTVLSAALVFNGVAHLRTVNSVQASSQIPVVAPVAAAPATASIPELQVPPAVPDLTQTGAQANFPGVTAPPADEPEQDAAFDADSMEQTDEDAATEEVSQPITIPAGTPLTVRLGESLGSTISQSGQSFSAKLDQDVVVDGQTVVAAGTIVGGKVVSARPAGPLEGEADLQLKLTSLKVNDTKLALTTSVRSFGSPIKGKNKVGKFVKGLAKRAEGEEREVVLAEQSAYSFTLRQPLQIQ